MKKKTVCLLLLAAIMMSMCSCNVKVTINNGSETANGSSETDEASENEESEDEQAEETGSTDYSTGSPWVDPDILSNVEAYGDTDLKDNFAMAENAQWVMDNPIEDGKSFVTYITSFDDTLHERLTGIITDDSDTEDHNAELVRTLYNEFLDWDQRDELGAEPLKPYLIDIENIEDMDDFTNYSTKPETTYAQILAVSTYIDPNDSSRRIILTTSPEFFLNDAADYKNLDSMSNDVQLTYDCAKKGVETVLSKCGYSDSRIDEIFDGAIEYEQLIAENCYTNDDMTLTETDTTIKKQVYTADDLEHYDWFKMVEQLLSSYDLDEIPGVLLYEKMDYFEQLDDLICEDNLELMKDYLLAHTASATIEYLDRDSYYTALDISNELYGSDGYKEESEYGVDVVSGYLKWPLSKLYVDRYVTAEDKQNITDIIYDIVDEYREMLQDEDFLSDATKKEAINKLDNLGINCMYPDDWSYYDYSDLDLSDNYFDTITAINTFETEKTFSELYEPVTQDLWVNTPIMENALYSPNRNTINIYPGLIGDVLYNSDMSKEEIYAQLGVVIGHEISHAFDSNGARYDAEGNIKNWWTDEDYDNFNRLTDRLVEYYNGITIWDGLDCNGELIKTEACADMGGMAVILNLAAKDDDFDYEKFFESNARLWAANSSTAYEAYRAKYNVHPIWYLRTNVTVAQFDEFYDTFGIEEGDGMYIAPEDRVKIW